jgi:hypothetical protein
MAGKRNLVKAAEAGEAWNSARRLPAWVCKNSAVGGSMAQEEEREVLASARALGSRLGHKERESSSRRTAWVRATARAR